MSRTEVSYALDAEVYLFGSIAKGYYSKMSDIDLLILIPNNMETKEIRSLRHELEDRIEACYISRSVDIKLYYRDRYNELSQNPCFEQVIQKDLVCISNW